MRRREAARAPRGANLECHGKSSATSHAREAREPLRIQLSSPAAGGARVRRGAAADAGAARERTQQRDRDDGGGHAEEGNGPQRVQQVDERVVGVHGGTAEQPCRFGGPRDEQVEVDVQAALGHDELRAALHHRAHGGRLVHHAW